MAAVSAQHLGQTLQVLEAVEKRRQEMPAEITAEQEHRVTVALAGQAQ
jgi:hypothetical protein